MSFQKNIQTATPRPAESESRRLPDSPSRGSYNCCHFSFDVILQAEHFISINQCTIYHTSGFWPRMRARALRAPVFQGSLLRAPPRPSQLRCFLFDPQKYLHSVKLGTPTSRAFFYPLDHRGYEIGSPSLSFYFSFSFSSYSSLLILLFLSLLILLVGAILLLLLLPFLIHLGSNSCIYRQSITQLILFNRATAGGTVNLHASLSLSISLHLYHSLSKPSISSAQSV